MDEISLKIEPEKELKASALAALSGKIGERLKMKTNLRFNIKPTRPGELPRYTLKSKRFKDLRGVSDDEN